jgi:uncharacterized membrane protein
MAIRGLEDQVKSWVTKGIISPEQGDEILTHESSATGRPWVMYGVAAVGVFAIALGIISIIASNWADITPTQKLLSYFFWQILLGWAFFQQVDKPGLKREIYLSLFCLTILGGIALVGQIYHLKSDGWQGLSFWLLLILPGTLLAQTKFLPMLWVSSFFLTLEIFFWSKLSNYFFVNNTLEAERNSELLQLRLNYFLILLLFIALGPLKSKTRNISLSGFCEAALKVSGFILLVLSVPYINHLYTSYKQFIPFSVLEILPSLTVAILVGFTYLRRADEEGSPLGNRLIGILIISTAIFWVLPLMLNNLRSDILGALIFIILYGLAAAAAASYNSRRLFNVLSFGIALRFLFIYFEVFGSLAATGVGLIISGLLILSTLWAWYSYKDRFSAIFRRLP